MKIGFNSVFKDFNRTKRRYRIAKGSAGSGKSVNIALDYIIKLSDMKYKGANLLVVRGVETANSTSTFPELVKAINTLGLNNVWDIKVAPLQLRNTVTGNSIIFRGCNDERARERLKSVTFASGKLTWIWVEEATELREADIDILDDRLRGVLDNENLYYQITLSFNPISASHWIKRRFWDYENDEIFKCHSTFFDNRFIDEAFKKRMEMRKDVDPEGYKIYCLGEWGEQGGLIFTNYTVEELPIEHSRYNSVIYAQDFGYNHFNCILEVGFKDGDIYVLREMYEREKDTAELIEIAERFNFDKHKIMYCDSAEPDRIQMWKKAGYKALPVRKEKGSVKAQIDYLKQHKIHINAICQNTIKEIQSYKWVKDNKTGCYTDEPITINDDAMACLRYCVEQYRRVKPSTLPKSLLGL